MRKRNFFLVILTTVMVGFVISSCRKDDLTPEDHGNLLGAHALDADRPLPYTYCDWMAGLSDNAFINQVTIPGTHDCGADLHTSQQGTVSDLVIAQDFRLSNQLKLGVRWFDVRVALGDDGSLPVFHGDYYLHKNFSDLVRQALDFLAQYPSEVVVFMIKQEHSGSSDYHFAEAIYAALQSFGLEHFFLSTYTMPTIGELRGKIMITRQFANDLNKDLGYHFSWDNNTKGAHFSPGQCKLYVQDHYSCFWVTNGTKIDEIKECSRQAHREMDPNTFYLNFTSCERDLEDLKSIASGINPEVSSWLVTPPVFPQCGIIMVNFAGGSDDGSVPTDFVRNIIKCNENAFVTNEFTLDNQVWKTQNLSATHYRNGDPIFCAFDPLQWQTYCAMGMGAFSYTNPHSGEAGMYYNWAAVNDPRGLGQEGWRVPEQSDFFLLGAYLGRESVAGGKMKMSGSIEMWKQPNTGATNSSGFSAIPMGYRDATGYYYHENMEVVFSSSTIKFVNGISANFWTTTSLDQNTAIAYRLQYDTAALLHGPVNKSNGYSVRLVKDYTE